jgi:hydroxylaminobenzene mutase
MDIAGTLCFSGVLLFLLGLLTGAAIPAMRSGRIGLSAHLAGVQSGTFLIAAGLVWPRLTLTGWWGELVGHGLWISLFALWLSLLLAGIFGAGRGLAIAGQGITTSAVKQRLVTVLLIAGSIGCVLAVVGMLIGWRWTA